MRRPLRALLSAILGAVVLTGLLFAQAAFHAEQEATNPSELVAATIEQNFGANTGHGSFYLNRWSAITFWFEQHSLAEPMTVLIGHGARSSREGGTGLDAARTLAAVKYPGFGIGLTGVPALLWETGVVGLTLVFAMFWSAFRAAGVLKDHYSGDPWQSGLFSGLQAGVAILALGLFHKAYFVFDLGYQTIIMLLFGYLAYSVLLVEEQIGRSPAG